MLHLVMSLCNAFTQVGFLGAEAQSLCLLLWLLDTPLGINQVQVKRLQEKTAWGDKMLSLELLVH